MTRLNTELDFWNKVSVSSNDKCWKWLGVIDKSTGRGHFSIDRKTYYPIHFMFLLDGIDIPSGMMIFNKCGNLLCVNPNHYELGTKFGRELNNQIRTKKSIENRFWNLVSIKTKDDCWEWEASFDGKGYGQFNIDGRTYRSHRVAWELLNGKIPNGLELCHHCDNPKCVNPNHLFLGTHKDNMHDMKLKGRNKK